MYKKIMPFFIISIALIGCTPPTPVPSRVVLLTPQENKVMSPISEEKEMNISLAMVEIHDEVALEDETTFGCGDTIKFVQAVMPQQENMLLVTLEALFHYIPPISSTVNISNSLLDSSITIKRADVVGGIVYVDLTGKLMSAGTCATPRVKEQIIQTINKYTNTQKIIITLNGSETEWKCWGDESGLCS